MRNELIKEFNGKNVLVVGLGLQGGGVGLIRFLSELGAKVVVTDLKSEKDLSPSIEKLKKYKILYTLGQHKLEDFLNANVIFKGPSVPWDLGELAEAQKRGVPVEMETSFFAARCPAKIIGVTGTRGKSTTTQMVFEILRQSDRSVYQAGNIPQVSTIELLNSVKKDDVVVLELSSWQLSGFHRRKISPHIAVLTNFSPDHLNYYKSMEDYFYDKKAIYLYQKKEDYLFANRALESTIKKDSPASKVKFFDKNDFLCNISLQGEHNKANAAAALFVSSLMDVDRDEAINIISNFQGLPYRQQLVRKIGKVSFINDATSTTPVATITALNSFQQKPIVLILGGNSKGLPINQLIESLNLAQKIVLLKGTMTDELLEALKEEHADKFTLIYDDLDHAVEEAYRKAKDLGKECLVLFSPGATSFAMFKNEFHRGEEFNRIVSQLNHETQSS